MVTCAYIRTCIEKTIIKYENENINDSDYVNLKHEIINENEKQILEKYSDYETTCKMVEIMINNVEKFTIVARIAIIKTFNMFIKRVYNKENNFIMELELHIKLFTIMKYEDNALHKV